MLNITTGLISLTRCHEVRSGSGSTVIAYTQLLSRYLGHFSNTERKMNFGYDESATKINSSTCLVKFSVSFVIMYV